jgi:hypothetical protein
LLDVKEKWIYTCQTNIKISTRNIATVEGKANGFTAIGKAYANVLVSNSESNTPQITPTPLFPNTGFPPEEKNIL